MEKYRSLCRIIIQHEYFDGKPCTAIQLSLSPQGKLLARQRGLLFHHIFSNEWEILYDAEGAGVDTVHDVLELELRITDPNFVLYTAWKDVNPSSAYMLELPLSTEANDATTVIRLADIKRRVGTPLCTVRLHLTEKLMKTAETEFSEVCKLHFHTPKLYWEYIFIPRNNLSSMPIGELLLEDTTGQITFCKLDTIQAYGHEACRAKSTDSIPVRSTYEYRLRLVVQDSDKGMSKRVLIKQVELPILGRFQSDSANHLRQICYY